MGQGLFLSAAHPSPPSSTKVVSIDPAVGSELGTSQLGGPAVGVPSGDGNVLSFGLHQVLDFRHTPRLGPAGFLGL